MGRLTLFPRTTTLNLVRLPNGSFTADPDGRILASTLPHSFPQTWVEDIGRQVVATFAAAHAAQLPLHELVVHFSALRLTARALRGGAVIFLSPQGLGRK